MRFHIHTDPVRRFQVGLLLLISITIGFSRESDQGTVSTIKATISLKDLPLGEEVKSSGKKLINQPFGFIRISDGDTLTDSTIVVAVHGYASRGYEWVYPLHRLVAAYGTVYFYRYDWELCPAEAAKQLAVRLNALISALPETGKVVILSHSYGGIVATIAMQWLRVPRSLEVHTIAAPLAGYPGLTDRCGLDSAALRRMYVMPDGNIHHYQWRTRKEQDKAFRKLPADPQVVVIPNSKVFRLPATMDGHRLGHNWSVSWVTDEYRRLFLPSSSGK